MISLSCRRPCKRGKTTFATIPYHPMPFTQINPDIPPDHAFLTLIKSPLRYSYAGETDYAV